MKIKVYSIFISIFFFSYLSSQNLVQNGSFEQPNIGGCGFGTSCNIPNWTLTGCGGTPNIIIPSCNGGSPDASDGNQAVQLYSETNNGIATMRQTITVSPCNTYRFSFDYSSVYSPVECFNWSVSGGHSASGLAVGTTSWQNNSFTFTPTTNSVTLSFTTTPTGSCPGSTNGSSYTSPQLDNVRLVVESSATINTSENITTCGSAVINGTTYSSSQSISNTFTSSGGCDSIHTVILTINNNTFSTDIQTSCGPYTWIDGNTYNTSTNSPTFTITKPNGCDSVITLNLTVTPNQTGTDVEVACGSFTWIDGNTYTSSNNTATFIIPNGASNGCDSIVTLNLTINSTVSETDIQSACGSFTWIDGNTYTTSNNTATFTIPNGATNGCDSVVTLDLTINSTVSETDIQSACGSFIWIDGNTYTSSNNTATFTIPSSLPGGCDTIITLDLTINTTQTGTDTQSACDSFTWIDGNTYTSSNNTATFTIPNGAANGCDSIVTLDLTINSTQTGTDTQTGCDSFTWIDGNTYTSSNNTATFTIPNGTVGGCDSIVTLDLTINSTQTGTDTQTACDSFTWIDGNTYTSSNNTATFTIPNGAANGCDSIVTLDLTINSTQTGTDTQTACDSFTWIDGNTYTSSNNTATFTIPNGATNGCDSIVTLDLTMNSTQTGTDTQTACDSFTWIDGNTYTSSNNTATFTIPNGATNGCDSIVSLDLTINSTITVTDLQTACDSFTWIDGNTYTSSNNTATFTIPNGAANGCDSIVSLDLTINSTQTGTDVQTACDSFTWIDGNTYTSSNNSATFTIPNGAANGCDSIVTLDLTINSTQTGTDTQSACDSFTWIDGNTYTSSNNTATFTIPNGTVGGCDSIVTLDLTINSTQTGTDTQTACNSFTWIDGNTYTNSNNTATFTIPNGATNGCDSIVSLDLTVNLSDSTFEIQSSCFANDTGSVSQTTSNQFGCDSVHTVTTNLIEVPYTVSPDFATINSKDSLSFFIDNQDSNLRFEWQASDNESCGPLCANFVVNPTENTTFYYFTLVDTSSNCSVTDTLRVDLEYFSQLNVPNIFTPNGDGENDIFRSYGEDIVEYKLEIFDRWGGKMFESNELPSGWNGLFKGSPVESGVYIAVITAAGADGQRYEIVQNIKLVR